MSEVIVTESYLEDIAEAIRGKNGTQNTYKPGQMALAIQAITIPTIEPLSVTSNGTYTSQDGGYSPIVVNVSGSSPVINPLSVTQNGTYTAPSGVDGYSPITVNVSGGGGSGLTLLATQSLGHLETTSTSSTSTGKTITIPDVGYYDLIIIICSDDTPTNDRYLATVSSAIMSGAADITERTSLTNVGRYIEYRISSDGKTQSRQTTSGYGVVATMPTILDNGKLNASINMRYHSTYTGTIYGDYTARAYGVNLYDLFK